MCLDKGYDYEEVRATLRAFGFTAHIRNRGEEAKEIAREAGKCVQRWWRSAVIIGAIGFAVC